MKAAIDMHPSGPIRLPRKFKDCKLLSLRDWSVDIPFEDTNFPSVICSSDVFICSIDTSVRMLLSLTPSGKSSALSVSSSNPKKISPKTVLRHFPHLDVASELLAKSQYICSVCCHQPRVMISRGMLGQTICFQSRIKSSSCKLSCKHCSAQRNSWNVRWANLKVSSPSSVNHVSTGNLPFLIMSSMSFQCSMVNSAPTPLVLTALSIRGLLKSRMPLPCCCVCARNATCFRTARRALADISRCPAAAASTMETWEPLAFSMLPSMPSRAML
mmetsp:Transcript_5546/g.8288  ORF Transcript_5546/g.8288 Transcript_5546/m.8288 type:complete len:272 (-) Transcript_5546:295-1110(-)